MADEVYSGLQVILSQQQTFDEMNFLVEVTTTSAARRADRNIAEGVSSTDLAYN